MSVDLFVVSVVLVVSSGGDSWFRCRWGCFSVFCLVRVIVVQFVVLIVVALFLCIVA